MVPQSEHRIFSIWRRELDQGSRKEALKAVNELKECGFIKSPLKSIEFTPIKYYGTMAYTKCISYAELEDGTMLMLLVIGPAYFDRRPWYPSWADIKLADESKVSPYIINNGVIYLSRECSLPVVWSPRIPCFKIPIINHWGLDLGKKWQEKYLSILSKPIEK